MAKTFYHPSIDDLTMDGILYALSDPVRRNMVFRLMKCPGMNCSEVCEEQLSASTISFHTRILREAGLIHSEKQGVSVINTARKEEIEKRFPGLLHAVFQHHLAEVKAKNKSKKTGKEIKMSKVVK